MVKTTEETQTVTVQSLAQEMSRAFEQKKRDSGEEFVVLKEDSPTWMGAVCHAAHYDILPNDWRYRFIEDAVDALADHEGEEMQEADEYLREYVYPYPHEQTGWLHSHNERVGYCDEAWEASGYYTNRDNPTLSLIEGGMRAEQREVFDLVLQALEERVGVVTELTCSICGRAREVGELCRNPKCPMRIP